MNANEIIRQAVLKARESWEDYTLSQQKKIYELFSQTAEILTANLARYSVEGKIPPLKLKILLNQVEGQMKFMRPKLRSIIRSGQKESVSLGLEFSIIGAASAVAKNLKTGIGTSFIGKDGKVVRWDASIETFLESAWNRINVGAMDALMRTEYGGIAFSRRVWDITWPVERQIRNQINIAVLTGKSVNSVAKNIKGYLGISKGFKTTPIGEFHPGAGVYKSAYKNSLRLASSEMNRAFNEGIIRYGKEKKWVNGYILRIGSGNPCDECLDMADQFYEKGDEPQVPIHPHCSCWLQISYEDN